MSRYEQTVKDGAKPFLEDGEEVLAAVIAAPRGYTQSVAGSMNLWAHQRGRQGAVAADAGLRLEAPMALASTQRRLMTLNVGTPIGLGIGGKVKVLLSAVPLADVESMGGQAPRSATGSRSPCAACHSGSRPTPRPARRGSPRSWSARGP